MLNDLRYAARTLLHAKGWTAVVVFSLALGIGANTALFSGVNGCCCSKVPVSDPDTLVRLQLGWPQPDGHELQRLRLDPSGRLGAGRAHDVLVPDVSAVRRRTTRR